MNSITDIAVCIRRWDYSETSQTVSLFGRAHGILRGIVKGAKRPKGKFAGGIDLLTHGQIVAIVKPSSDLAIITEWTLQEMYRGPRDNLDANRAGLYMADLVHHMLHEHDPHPKLFDAFSKSLSALEDTKRISLTLLSFQWAILCETGFKPELDHDAQTGEAFEGNESTYAFSSAAGGVVADTGTGDRWRVRSETIKLLRNIAANQSEMNAQSATVDRANRLLAVYIREVIGKEPNAMQWAFPEK
ncbi:MAG: DNA repair protein RecO [Planctomycetes bacterium]|nr:DNA repair protein RecO [Planctomycetota bacterium]